MNLWVIIYRSKTSERWWLINEIYDNFELAKQAQVMDKKLCNNKYIYKLCKLEEAKNAKS